MKKPIHPAVAAIAAMAVALSPMLFAQTTSGPDQTDNSRATNSTADQHADANGSSASQPGTLQKNDSKAGASESRDANPGSATTDSAQTSGTKAPDAMDDKTAATHTHHHSDKMTDKEFMMKAAQGGMTEVELGKVAQDKGGTDDIKDFGARMVKDHTKANDELMDLAKKKGVMLSPSLDTMHQGMVDKMKAMSGAAFDKSYVMGMVKDHLKTVNMFEEEAKSGQDADVKAFASKTLPTLKDHYASIKKIQAGMK